MMTNREKMAALVSENAERILAKGALRFDCLSEFYCDMSPLHPDGCIGESAGDCAECLKLWLDSPVSAELRYEDDFLYPPDAGFICSGGGDD